MLRLAGVGPKKVKVLYEKHEPKREGNALADEFGQFGVRVYRVQ